MPTALMVRICVVENNFRNEGGALGHAVSQIHRQDGDCGTSHGVLPTRTRPCQRKWRVHFWRRGLNSQTFFPVLESIPARLGPLWLLFCEACDSQV